MNHIMGKMRMPAMPRLTVSASYFSQIMDCSNPDIHRVLPDISSSVFVLKGSKIIDFGQKHTCFHLLEKSIARAHGLSADGDEVTDCLVFVPGTPVMTSADTTTPSPECFEALTVCALIKLKISDFYRTAGSIPQLLSIYISLLESAWHNHWKVENAIRHLSAKNRYEWFLREYPGLIDAIPHRYIASFLGMTPATLSRVQSQHRSRSASVQQPH